MIIKLSKSKWENIGKKAGWIKRASTESFLVTIDLDDLDGDHSEELYAMIFETKEIENAISNVLRAKFPRDFSGVDINRR